jgi:phage/plasmid-associated DNA primase
MRQSFLGREELDLTYTLLGERSGILNLALDALDRLRVRGRFVQPESGVQLAEELMGLASNINLFVRDCCVVGPEHEVFVGELYTRWRCWCLEKGIRYAWEENHFSQKLIAAVRTVTRGRPRSGGPGRPTMLLGIGLKPGVLNVW